MYDCRPELTNGTGRNNKACRCATGSIPEWCLFDVKLPEYHYRDPALLGNHIGKNLIHTRSQ
eukprot:4548371-Amphidinium_carterae.1